VSGKDPTTARTSGGGGLDSESALAAELAHTFDLPLGVALQVAAGTLSLQEAQERNTESPDLKPDAEAHRAPQADPASLLKAASTISRKKEEENEAAVGKPTAPPAPRETSPAKPADELADLSSVHGLPRHLARMVVDGRLTLEAAQLQKQSLDRAERQRKRREGSARAASAARRSRRWIVPVSLVLLAAAAGAGFLGWRSWREQVARGRQVAALTEAARANEIAAAQGRDTDRPLSPEALALRSTEVRTDEIGRVVEVRGPNPQAVLTAYCRTASGITGREPVELVDARPRQRGMWLGLFRDRNEIMSLYAIKIRQDHEARQWVAGDGESPLDPFVPDPARLGAGRITMVASLQRR
jgi:hypothetical protein